MMRLVNINICDSFTVIVEAEDRYDAECKARELGDNLTEALEKAGWGHCIEDFIDTPDSIHTSRRGLDLEIDCCDQGAIALPAGEEVGYTIVKADLEQMTNGAPHGSLGEAMLLDTGQVFPSREEAERKVKDYNNQGSAYFYWAVPVAIMV